MDDKTSVIPTDDKRGAYEPPALTPLGTIEDMTQLVGNSGADDGGLKTGDGG